MKTNDDCWRIFQSYIQSKENVKRQRLNKLDYIFHKEPLNLQDAIEEANKNLKKKEKEKTHSKFPSMVNSQTDFNIASPHYEES